MACRVGGEGEHTRFFDKDGSLRANFKYHKNQMTQNLNPPKMGQLKFISTKIAHEHSLPSYFKMLYIHVRLLSSYFLNTGTE